MFQSTLPHGERPLAQGDPTEITEFQSTLPHGERLDALEELREERSFNPRSRTGSDATGPKERPRRSVSIHAPARGATLRRANYRLIEEVSIHAPARGATWTRLRNFERKEVSIHAPARGATIRPRNPVSAKLFQSTLPHGERREAIGFKLPDSGFNPRSRTGSDTQKPACGIRGGCFNPRSRTGSDRCFLVE